jgi:hypothetical protein
MSTASDAIEEASRSVGSAEFPGSAVGGMGCSTWAGPVVREGAEIVGWSEAHADPRSAVTSREATIPTSVFRLPNGCPPAKVARFRRSAHDTASFSGG